MHKILRFSVIVFFVMTFAALGSGQNVIFGNNPDLPELDPLFSNASGNIAYINQTNNFTFAQVIQGIRLTNMSDNGLWNNSLHIYAGDGSGSPNNIIFTVNDNELPHFWIQTTDQEQASGIIGSFMIVNENPQLQNTTNITSCIGYMDWANETLQIDCNTTGTGADLLIGDDLQVIDEAWFKDSENEWHPMRRELELRDHITNNMLFNTISISFVDSVLQINDTDRETLLIIISANNTDLERTNDSITINTGTDTIPAKNFIFYELTGITPGLTVQSTHAEDDHADICSLSIGSTVQNQFWGICGIERGDEFITRVTHHLFELGFLFESGFNITSSSSDVSYTSGVYHAVGDEFDSTDTKTMSEGYYFLYSNGTYHEATALDDITEYSDGTAISNNKVVNVVWGMVKLDNGSTGASRLIAVIQDFPGSGKEYSNAASAETDNLQKTRLFPSDGDIKHLFLPIARTLVRVSGSSSFLSFQNSNFHLDVRGATTGVGGSPPSPSIIDHSALNNLNLSVAGHVFDVDIGMVGFNFNASNVSFVHLNATSGTFIENVSAAYLIGNLSNATFPITICSGDDKISTLGGDGTGICTTDQTGGDTTIGHVGAINVSAGAFGSNIGDGTGNYSVPQNFTVGGNLTVLGNIYDPELITFLRGEIIRNIEADILEIVARAIVASNNLNITNNLTINGTKIFHNGTGLCWNAC